MTLLAVITGGGTGIGRAQALALSKIDDTIVIITGRRKEPLEATQLEIGTDKCHILADCDSGKVESWKRIVDKVAELGGGLHFLGNTAGSTGKLYTSYEALDPDEIVAYNTTYISGIQLSYHFLPPLLIKGAKA